MKRMFILMLILVSAFAFSAPAFANHASQVMENAQSTDYVTKAPAMLLRGVGNLVLSPVEVVVHGYKGTVEGKPVLGTIEGLGHGVYWTLDRAGRGVWDVLTFWAPNYNGAPPEHELEF